MNARLHINAVIGTLLMVVSSNITVLSAENDAFPVIPADRYALQRLANAWNGLQVFIHGMHQNMGTPLNSSGIYYVSPLLDSIDKHAAERRRAGRVIELRNLSTMGPDGGYLYSWVYYLPATATLGVNDIFLCYEAVGIARGAGVIKPSGEFESTPLPFGLGTQLDGADASCKAVVQAATR